MITPVLLSQYGRILTEDGLIDWLDRSSLHHLCCPNEINLFVEIRLFLHFHTLSSILINFLA